MDKNVTIVFESSVDRLKFVIEEGFEKVFEDESDTLKLEIKENHLKNRLKKRRVLKDYRKSIATTNQWRSNRNRFMRGIKRFHKSTKGKQLHRVLSRHNATRDYKTRHSLIESAVALNSMRVHVLIGCKYYSSIDEEVDYEMFVEKALSYIDPLIKKFDFAILEGNEINLSAEEHQFLDDMVWDANYE